MHDWLKSLTITSYPIFFQLFKRWININPYWRILTEGNNNLRYSLGKTNWHSSVCSLY